MSSGFTSGFAAEAYEFPNSQGTPALPCTSSVHHEPVCSRTSSEPTEPPRQAKSEPTAHQTRRSFRRVRRQPVDPSLDRVSTKPEHPAHPGGQRPKYDIEEVLKRVLPRTEGTNLFPEFDATGSYVESDVVLKMWHDETTRVMQFANSPEMPLEFRSNGFFQGDTEKGYIDVSKLSQQILTAIAICRLDNECVNAEHCGWLSNQQRLSSLIDHVTKSQHVAQTMTGLEHHEASQQMSRSLAATDTLVNYISAVLTRLIIKTSPGQYWETNVLSILIRRITKIKLVLRDLQANSAIAITAAQAVLDSKRSEWREGGDTRHPSNKIDEEMEFYEYIRILETHEQQGTASYEENQIAAHCVEQSKYRLGLDSALRDISMSIRFTNRSGTLEKSFEVCAVTYDGGFGGFRALVYQDRDLEYSATSDTDNLSTAYSAFDILQCIVTRFYERHDRTASHIFGRPEQRDHCTDCMETKLDLTIQSLTRKSDSFEQWTTHRRLDPLPLNTMDQVITVLIPLAMTHPAFLNNFTSLRHVMAPHDFIRDDFQPPEKEGVHVYVRMYTKQFDDIAKTRPFDDRGEKQPAQRLYQAIGPNLPCGTRRVVPKQAGETKAKATHQLNEQMSGWVVDEMSITVPCPGYVWSVIAIAILVAGGGLGIGFSVGERIHGVDPSNLAPYLWLVAAFIILIAKNVKVKEWGWNEFLRRRVRCCSVSELESITGIDGQVIIAKLLHDERRGSVLNIRGPYNSAFLRTANEGFSIDKPISSSTLLGSGLVMLQVATARGCALVCLDFRRGTDLSVIGHTPDAEKEYLICEQIENFQFGYSGTTRKLQAHDNTHVFSRSRRLKWKRVLGFYYSKEAKFI